MRYLLVDVGAGTMDVLVFDESDPLPLKAVGISPVRTLARKVEESSGNLLVVGGEMGGGPVSRALIERARSSRVVMSESAAATVHHDLDRVRAHGIEVIADDGAVTGEWEGYGRIRLADIDPARLRRMVEPLGAGFAFDLVGVCAQDHGMPPPGASHLEGRHRRFADGLQDMPRPGRLLYPAGAIPDGLGRLRTMAADAGGVGAAEVYVMDSGMAALLGATTDPACRACRHRVVLDVATSHTVCGTFEGDDLCGFFEYHTRDVTVDRLDDLIVALADGRVRHEQILAEGGHGAWVRKAMGFERVEVILATGPRRDLLTASRHPIVWGAPLGDNMMTGTAGLLEAIRTTRRVSGRRQERFILPV